MKIISQIFFAYIKMKNQLISPHQSNITTKGVFSLLVFAMLMLGMSWKAKAQITYTWTGSSTEWLNNSNWSPSTAYAGSKTVTTNNDIAYFNINTATNVGINMTTQAGTHYLGALYFGTSSTSSRAVLNSTGTFGTLYFNGVSLNGVNNTIIWQQSNSNHYFNWGSSPFNLGLNATDHVIQITGNGGLFIASVITGASKNLEKAGTGSGVLTLQSINTYTGNTTISAGTLALSGTGSIATSPNIIIGSSGRFDVSGLNTALTLASTQTLKASATGGNTTGSIILGTSKNLTLSAGGLTFTALASTTNPALTVSGGASSIVLNSSPITVPNNLSVGTYKLIGKFQSATVTGTPGTLSYTGSSNNTSASVALTGGELVLTVITLSAPTVTNTTPATNIATTSATLAGNVTSIGTASISNNGSVYSLTATNAAPQISGTGVTQLATSSPGAGTGTFSNNVSSTLSVNAQYSFNAYAINSVGTSYGTVSTFFTLANVPSAPTVNNPTTSSLDVIINVNSNPSATEFAIQETGGNYVQANGTLSGSAVWQTAATWGTKTVTGLASSTTYTFQVKARNGANTETTFGTSAGGLVSAIPTNNWTGGTGNWNTGSNWSLSRVPLNTDNITISSGSPVMDINHTLTTGRTLTISGTGSLTINPTISLTIAGVADFGGKLVTLKSDATGTASIGTVAGTLNNATNLTVERYIPANGRRYRFLASPVVGGTTLQWRDNGGSTSGRGIQITGPTGTVDASTNNAKSAFYYLETNTTGTINDAAKWPSIDGSTTLTNGQGYRVFVRGDRSISLTTLNTVNNATTIWVNGSYPSGTRTLPVTYTNVTGGGQGWNLVGNPYPCSIDWMAASGWTKTNVGTGVAIWRPSTNSYAYSLASSDASDNVNVSVNGGGTVIGSGQGFFVRATGTSPALSCTENIKVLTAPTTLLLKTVPSNQLRIKLTQDTSNIDETLIVFGSKFQDEFIESEDFSKIPNPTVNISSVVGTEQYAAINFTSNNYAEKTIPLSVWGNSSGTYQLDLTQVSGFDAAVSIYLRDKYLNTTTAIDHDKNIPVIITDDSLSKGDKRFELLFKNIATNNNELTNNISNTQLSVYPNPALVVLNISLLHGTAIETVNIYNVSGKLVNFTKLNGNQIDISQLNNGVYMLEAITANGTFKTKFVK
jgi:autotransporter-associated beta strand protein